MELVQNLKQEPDMGTSIGNGCYKIRIAIASKGRGKSGGARLITCVLVTRTTVFLLSIYDKSVKANISDSELKALLKSIE